MEIKTIQQIKEEYAKSLDDGTFKDYENFRNYNELQEDDLDTICFLYASQFQQQNEVLRDRIAELEGMLGRCKNEFQQYRDAFGQSSSLESEIESLINKGK